MGRIPNTGKDKTQVEESLGEEGAAICAKSEGLRTDPWIEQCGLCDLVKGFDVAGGADLTL